MRNGFIRSRAGNFFSRRMGIEGSTSPRVFDPELRGLWMRLRLSFGGGWVFSVGGGGGVGYGKISGDVGLALFAATFLIDAIRVSLILITCLEIETLSRTKSLTFRGCARI